MNTSEAFTFWHVETATSPRGTVYHVEREYVRVGFEHVPTGRERLRSWSGVTIERSAR